jgi:uncharacterized protein (TIGR02996 family)
MIQDDGFLQAVLEDPDDDGVRLVYADWLEERGEPRAEFIRADCALARLRAGDPRRPALEGRRRQLLAEHGDAWLGRLRDLAYGWAFRRGFVEEVTVDARHFPRHADTFFAAPLRLVRLLHAGSVIQEVAECRHLRRLRALHLTDNNLGNRGLSTLLASPYLGGLTTLRLGNNGLTDTGAVLLANAPNLTGLAALNLSRNAIGDAGAEALAASPNLAGLTSLHLGSNLLRDAGAHALAAAPGLRRLKALDLANAPESFFNRNQIGRKQRRELRERFGAGVRFAAGRRSSPLSPRRGARGRG